jgi:SPP1 gp7 family putative phage head morphogenesis protein
MCELHVHNVYEYDPTRTTTLRNRMVAESNKRFDRLIKLLEEVVGQEDVFGLGDLQVNVMPPNKLTYSFLSNPDKIAEFNRWLQEQIEKGLIEVSEWEQLGKSYQSSWQNKYITDSYRRGVLRGRIEMKRAGYKFPDAEIADVMSVPLHIETLGLLYIRAFSELKGITLQMEQIISRILAQGLADGENPIVLAKRLVAAINGKGIGDLGLTDILGRFIPARRRAEILARTEIIRAHHQAMMNEYKNWGVLGVHVKAEFRTAGDSRVCSICAGLEGQIFTLDEIMNMIPVHPQCRCIALPVIVKNTKNK